MGDGPPHGELIRRYEQALAAWQLTIPEVVADWQANGLGPAEAATRLTRLTGIQADREAICAWFAFFSANRTSGPS